MTARGLIVSAPRSSSGKTTVTLGLLGALRRKGIAVRAAKSGPDYIDPAFHAAATAQKGVNLDSWAMPPAAIEALIGEAAQASDVLVIEGAMGLFDGVPGVPGRSGAASDLAARFALPVLLILDVSGQSQSAAAVAAGFASFDPKVRVGGVVLNKLGSDRHRTLIADALKPLGIPVLGAIPRDDKMVLPERHLGLVQAGEHVNLDARLASFAEMAARHLDLDAIMAMAAPLPDLSSSTAPTLKTPGQRIALASDATFSFVYAHVLDDWRRSGAEIVPFSPLRDEAPPDHCDVCWLPGGYPELHAGALAAAQRFKDGLKEFSRTRPVHGECGGYMVLGEGLEDASGTRHAMAGLLSHATSFAKRRLHLGYRQARLLADHPLGAAGDVVRGHEFHHASIIDKGSDEPFVEVTDAQGKPVVETGSRRELVSGTFFHAIARES
ncbi:cobyrinate a,c-diamide synthase [Rhodoplanes sp. Z2-YC6860]|uniref:cobyrinate a,c-diamide synthase n=1 Tax=Rhodoplanes sp. Z2-YC6860 TaxID=674703 RepID=UPI00078BA173|nr:cobyrinate a,c-diamide synthase [Rhodoplanes sp. Z2-YC6860]AMN43901.1 cobyrinic acid a,c-diamide synthase [Rhodoplanes sp. Z2-YC6860]